MKRRCYRKGDKDYRSYGAKGIQVCEEWRHSYVVFREWALRTGYSETLTIDRIEPTGDYCPDNCRWIPWFENVTRNAVPITAWGDTKFIWEWVKDERCLIQNKVLIRNRLNADWKPEDALAHPLRKHRSDRPSTEP
jgi:hypothetical protein